MYETKTNEPQHRKQCFDTVGCMTERASFLKKPLLQNHGGSCIWSEYCWKYHMACHV